MVVAIAAASLYWASRDALISLTVACWRGRCRMEREPRAVFMLEMAFFGSTRVETNRTSRTELLVGFF